MPATKRTLLLAIFLVCCLGVIDAAQAQGIPNVISFQGVLRNDDGSLIVNGNHKLKFSLYTAETATSSVWWEAKTVATVNGVFDTRLGDTVAFGLDFSTDLWLQVEIAVGVFYVPLGPRTQLTPSPSALFALQVPASSITSVELANASVTSAKLAAGTAVESLNNLTGVVSVTGGANVTVTESGNNIVIDAVAGAGGDDGDWAIDGLNLTHNTTGIVALGTSTPLRSVTGHALLQIQASLYPGLALDATSPSFGRWLMFHNGSSRDLLFSRATTTGLGTAMMILDDDGQLGVGKTPETTLDINGGNYLLSDTNNGDFQIGNSGNALQFGVDVAGLGAGRAKIRATSASDVPMLNLGVGNSDIISILEDRVRLFVDGSERARFWGGDANDRGGQLFMYGLGSTATIELDGYSGSGGYIGIDTEAGLAAVSLDATLSGGRIQCRDSAGNITVTIDGEYSDGFGRVQTQVLEITGGADLSEQFKISLADQMRSLQPGLVVSIDPQNPGELQVCRTAYDRKVAGVLSGAGGVRPGMLMGQKGSAADGDHPVALTGRVYVQADATTGAIVPGDLLTTSALAGHAMKVTDHSRANGAILGKAMTGLADGQGLVLVLVSLQ